MGPQYVVRGLGGEDKKTEWVPDQIIFQGLRAWTVCSRFFIFLHMNGLAVCLGLHTTLWYSGYCTASSQTNSAFWASALFVSMRHYKDWLGRNNSKNFQPPPMDKHCVCPHTHSISLHVRPQFCGTYLFCRDIPTLILLYIPYITSTPIHAFNGNIAKKSMF